MKKVRVRKKEKAMEEEEVDGCSGVTAGAGAGDQSQCFPVVSVVGSFHQTVLASNPRNQV